MQLTLCFIVAFLFVLTVTANNNAPPNAQFYTATGKGSTGTCYDGLWQTIEDKWGDYADEDDYECWDLSSIQCSGIATKTTFVRGMIVDYTGDSETQTTNNILDIVKRAFNENKPSSMSTEDAKTFTDTFELELKKLANDCNPGYTGIDCDFCARGFTSKKKNTCDECVEGFVGDYCYEPEGDVKAITFLYTFDGTSSECISEELETYIEETTSEIGDHYYYKPGEDEAIDTSIEIECVPGQNNQPAEYTVAVTLAESTASDDLKREEFMIALRDNLADNEAVDGDSITGEAFEEKQSLWEDFGISSEMLTVLIILGAVLGAGILLLIIAGIALA